MLKSFPYLFVCLLLATSCKREADDVQPTPTPIIEQPDPFTDFLRAAQSSPAADEYVSGEFDGAAVYCAANTWPDQSNILYVYTANNQENGSMSRETPKADVQLTITFLNTGLFQRAMPFAWPHPNLAYCEQIGVEVRKLGPHKEEQILFKGGSSYGIPLRVEITSTANGMIEGTFKGQLNQYAGGKYTGNTFMVKNGKFKIKMAVVSI